MDQVDNLVSKYASLFDGGLGTIKGVTAHLKLKEHATPQFFKPRPVPFPLKEKIAEELKRLQRIGVLEEGGILRLGHSYCPSFKTRWHREDLWRL